jgi:hypothetical protein
VIIVQAVERAFRSSLSIAIAGTASPLNDLNSRKRGGYHSRIWSIIPAKIRSGSVYLSKDLPDTHLSGKSHEVILMDDRDHAGILMAHVVECAASAEPFSRMLAPAGSCASCKCLRNERR